MSHRAAAPCLWGRRASGAGLSHRLGTLEDKEHPGARAWVRTDRALARAAGTRRNFLPPRPRLHTEPALPLGLQTPLQRAESAHRGFVSHVGLCHAVFSLPLACWVFCLQPFKDRANLCPYKPGAARLGPGACRLRLDKGHLGF